MVGYKRRMPYGVFKVLDSSIHADSSWAYWDELMRHWFRVNNLESS